MCDIVYICEWVWVGDGFCDILKGGAKFCEGERVIAGIEGWVYLSIIFNIIPIPLLTISSIYNIIQSSTKQTKQTNKKNNFPIDNSIKIC
jgi:hypothetical protein